MALIADWWQDNTIRLQERRSETVREDIIAVCFKDAREILGPPAVDCPVLELPLPPNAKLNLRFKYCLLLGTPGLFSDHASVAFVDQLCSFVSEQTVGFSQIGSIQQARQILPIYTEGVSQTWLYQFLPRLSCRKPLRGDLSLEAVTRFLRKTTITLSEAITIHCDITANELSGYEGVWKGQPEAFEMKRDTKSHGRELIFTKDAVENMAFFFTGCTSADHLVGCRVLSVDGVSIDTDVLKYFKHIHSFRPVEIVVQRPNPDVDVFAAVKRLEERVKQIRSLEVDRLRIEKSTLYDDVCQYLHKGGLHLCLRPSTLPRLLTLACVVGLKAKEYEILHKFSTQYPEIFWKQFCEEFKYSGKEKYVIKKTFEKIGNTIDAAFMPGTVLNVCYNMLDRNISEKGYGEKLALRFCFENGDEQSYTYKELRLCVCQCARFLRSQGIQHGNGSRVLLFLPKCPERIIYLLACFRIGVPVGVVHPSTSEKLLADQIKHSQCSVVVTGRGISGGDPSVEYKKLVRSKGDWLAQGTRVLFPDCSKFDFTNEKVTSLTVPCFCCPPQREKEAVEFESAEFDAESPLFFVFTSGSTGRSKTVEHAAFGYMVYTAVSFRYILDFNLSAGSRTEDVCFCTSDLAWLYGMTVGLCGPLLCGGTTVIYQGSFLPILSCPSPDEDQHFKADVMAEIIAKCKVTHFCTVPTGVVDFMNYSDQKGLFGDFSCLRVLTSAGSPFTRDLYENVRDLLENHEIRFTDIWWQTETGCFVMAAASKIGVKDPTTGFKDDVVTPKDLLAFYGISINIKMPLKDQFDRFSERASKCPKKSGELCITQPWPACVRRFLGDQENKQYMEKFDLKEFDESSWAFRSGDWTVQYVGVIPMFRVRARVDEWILLGDSDYQYHLNAVELEEMIAPRSRPEKFQIGLKRPKILANVKEAAVHHARVSNAPDDAFQLAVFVEYKKTKDYQDIIENFEKKDVEEIEDYLRQIRQEVAYPTPQKRLITFLAIVDRLPIKAGAGKKNRCWIRRAAAIVVKANGEQDAAKQIETDKGTFNLYILDVLPGSENNTEDQGQQLFKFRRGMRKTVYLSLIN